MNKNLIETITSLIIEKIGEQTEEKELPTVSTDSGVGIIKLWDHLSPKNQYMITGTSTANASETAPNSDGLVKLWDHVKSDESQITCCQVAEEDTILPELETRIGVSSPCNAAALKDWVTKTPARIGIGRAGLRPKTETWLRFRLDHGAAVDAVYGSVQQELLTLLISFR